MKHYPFQRLFIVDTIIFKLFHIFFTFQLFYMLFATSVEIHGEVSFKNFSFISGYSVRPSPLQMKCQND
ncbi:hypothetical protein D7H67_23865 [Bacillus sp. S66]|nr:hypothetical protein D7H67_23865 [Bacillus sp. S66]